MAKLSISRAWDETREVLTRDGRLIGAVALALMVLPGLVLGVVMPKAPGGGFPPAGPWMIVGFVAALISLAGQLAVVRLALGPHISVGEAIAHGARRLPYYAGAVLLWTVPLLLVGGFLFAAVGSDPEHPSLGASLGLLLLSVLGFYLMVRLILALPVASAEPVGSLAILRRSWDLSHGNWWRLFVFLLVFLIAAAVVLVTVGIVVGTLARVIFGEVEPLSVGGLLVAIVGQLVSACMFVVMFVMLARIYAQRAAGAEAHVSVPSSGI
jgi:hypothetical protein